MIVFILVSLATSAAACIYFVRIAKTRHGVGKACSVAFVGTILILSTAFFSPALCLQMALTFVASLTWLVGWRLSNSRRRARGTTGDDQNILPSLDADKQNRLFLTSLAIAAPIISYGFIVYSSIADLRELAKLRQKYPIESIAARLDYEHERTTSPKTRQSPRRNSL